MEISNKEKTILAKAGLVLLIVLCLYFAAKIVTEVRSYKFIGGGATASNTITFDGKGEINAAPDLATVSFTIKEIAKNMEDAQTRVTTKETAALSFLEQSGIEKKDIKTESYNSYPKYEYQNSVCPRPLEPQYDPYSGAVSSTAVYCPPGKQVLTGYEVSEYVSVKVRDLAKTGEIVKGIGAAGISEISGPNFSIENEDALKEQARQIAIDEAKAKAKSLSRDLGVRLVRIVNFSENGNYPMMMYAKGEAALDSVSSRTPAPALPTGENKIISNVTITYEIR